MLSCCQRIVGILFVLEALLIRSVSEEVQNRRYKGPVVLKDAAVPGVRIDRQLSIRQPTSHVGRKLAIDHEVTVAVGDKMVIKTQMTSEIADTAQRGVMEFLLPSRCPALHVLLLEDVAVEGLGLLVYDDRPVLEPDPGGVGDTPVAAFAGVLRSGLAGSMPWNQSANIVNAAGDAPVLPANKPIFEMDMIW